MNLAAAVAPPMLSIAIAVIQHMVYNHRLQSLRSGCSDYTD